MSTPPVSWCRFEAFVSKPEHVSVSESHGSLTPPPLVVLSLSLRTAPHPLTHCSEIMAAAGLVHTSFPLDRSAPKPVTYQSHFCAVTAPAECMFPLDFRGRVSGTPSSEMSRDIQILANERALICYIMAKLSKVATTSFCCRNYCQYRCILFTLLGSL